MSAIVTKTAKAIGVFVVCAAVGLTIGLNAGGHDGDDKDKDRKDHDKPSHGRRPKVVLISLDGAKPDMVRKLQRRGVLDSHTGLGRLDRRGVSADQNVTVTPSVTAVSHIAIATGSSAPHNDISGNTIHPVGATIGASLSGFGAPIGGYQLKPTLAPAPIPTAEPLWVQLRNASRQVVTATWPGGDGATVLVNGVVVQTPSPVRTVDYTVPFGAFGGLGAQGFTLGASSFTPADAAVTDQLKAAGRRSFSPVQVTASAIETFFCAPDTTSTCGTASASRTLQYDIVVAALDTTNDRRQNYDQVVFFNRRTGIAPGPFALPATGPAYVRAGRESKKFFFDGSGNKVGTSFFVNVLASDLSVVKFVRYGANFIPRNAPVLDAVDDVNNNVGFWTAQADFRIPERLSPGFTNFTDQELEDVYRDQVKTFVEYQTRLAQRAIETNEDADLVMVYIEQPDGSEHQFMLTDPRQATDPLDPSSISIPAPGANGQDPQKRARYARNLEFAYEVADHAVEEIIQTIGVDRDGEPLSDVFVVSDHGMAPFHTAVGLANLLAAAGITAPQIGFRTTGPAVNVYVNLAGREPGGTVSAADYPALVARIAATLRTARDPNPFYNPSADPLFTDVWSRPLGCTAGPGFCTDDNIGQDTGDVLALLAEGYNFDGAQAPVVIRLGDTASAAPVYSVPNFYGAHGHNSELTSMSAIFFAAGPSIRQGGQLRRVRNIDVAPTILEILGFSPAATMDGRPLREMLRRR